MGRDIMVAGRVIEHGFCVASIIFSTTISIVRRRGRLKPQLFPSGISQVSFAIIYVYKVCDIAYTISVLFVK